MIAKILSLSLLFLVAIIVAQSPIPSPTTCGDAVDQCYTFTPTCVQVPVDCTPNQCQTANSLCDALGNGCGFTNVTDYPIHLCNDGDACTELDSCMGGQCIGLPIMCDDPL